MASYERKEAVICSVKDLLSGKYYKMPGWDPNFVLIDSRVKASRINILGVITTKSSDEGHTSLTLDDGTGSIMMRSFEEQEFDVGPGDAALVIGRPRDFSDNLYIVPEIVRKVENMKWVEYRQKEIELLESQREALNPVDIDDSAIPSNSQEQLPQKKESTTPDLSQAAGSESKAQDKPLNGGEAENTEQKKENKKPSEKKKSDTEAIYEMIESFDSGDGAEISRILEEAERKGINNAEKSLRMMLEIGDIFEIKAGKVKVL